MQSRYAYFGLLYSPPAFAAALGVIGDRVRVKTACWVVLMAFFVATGWHGTLGIAAQRAGLTAGAPEKLVAESDLAASNEKLLTDAADPLYNPDISARRLDDPSIRKALPDVRPSAQAMFEASARMQVHAGPTRLPVGRPVAVRPHGISVRRGQQGHCRTGVAGTGAYLSVAAAKDGAQVILDSVATSVATVLTLEDRRSMPTVWPLTKGTATYVGTSRPDATLLVVLSPGPVTYCAS